MMKKILIFLLVALLAVSTGRSATLPDTTENIHLGLAFNYNVSDPSTLIGKVDYIWGATKNVPSIYMDVYMPYDRDPKTRSLAQWWNVEHPDWVVYKCDKTTPAYEFGSLHIVPLDITNPSVQDYQLQALNSYLSGTLQFGTGVGWDNLITENLWERCGIWRNAWIPLYGGQGVRDDPLFRAAVVDWAQTMYTKVKTQLPGKGVSMNVNYDTYATDLYPYLDLNLHEGGFTGFGVRLVADAKWLSTVRNFELLNDMNKAFFIINLYQVPDDASVTRSQVNWAIANYLMVKGSHSYMMIYWTYDSKYGYGTFYDRPEYHAQIGHPISARYAYQNVQRRDYSNGLVLVNPSSVNTYTVTLPATYADFYGTKWSSVTLAPTTAIVLFDLTEEVVKCANEGGFCGGIAGVQCCSGLKCQLEGNYPDAGGKCVKEISKVCMDSDGGKEYYIKGTTTSGSESKTDSCTYCTGLCQPGQPCNPTCGGVVEYYCESLSLKSGGLIKSEEYVCPNGCKDGACIQGTDFEMRKAVYWSEFNPTDPNNSPYLFGAEICIHGDKSINDLKKSIPGLKEGLPWKYTIVRIDGSIIEHTKYNALGGYIEEMKNGECTKIALSVQQVHYDAVDKAKRIILEIDQDNLVKETNENNNKKEVKLTVTTCNNDSICDYETHSMDVEDSVKFKGSTITLENVGQQGAVVVDVDGIKETLTVLVPEVVNGVPIKVEKTRYASIKTYRSATLTFGENSHFCGDCPNKPECFDSDNGKTFYEKGTVIERTQYSQWEPNIFSDMCSPSSPQGNLAEAVCKLGNDGYYYGSQIFFECPLGCKEGICLTNETTCASAADDCCFPEDDMVCDPDCDEDEDPDCVGCTSEPGDCCLSESDGICDTDCQTGEDPDCKEIGCNNNGVCELSKKENSGNCPEDCYCGDGLCDSTENKKDCPEDCRYCIPEWECRLEPAECPLEGIQNKVCTDVKCGTGEKREESVKCIPGTCYGCLTGGICYPVTTRMLLNEIPSYCDVTKNFKKQKELEAPCQNNYECKSNECSDGECISIKKELEETQSLLKKILDWLKNIF